eukprot:NODE_1102_length_2210_cov_0.800095.p1 type:complete len:282 gc:universal NODE_1102_length_2210_cov_0.800095:853-1698(+)
MTYSTVAVVGGSGGLGFHVTSALVHLNFKVKVLTRNEKDAKSKLQGLKVEYAVVDYKDKASLTQALRHVEVVISTLGGTALGEQFLLIEAAKEAHVKRFYTSEFGVDRSLTKDLPMFDLKEKAISAVKASGMEWTGVYTGLFSEYLFSPFLGVHQDTKSIQFVGSPNTKISTTPMKNIGEYVAASINSPSSKNAYVRVAADTLKYSEIAVIINKSHGNDWKIRYESMDKLKAKIDGNPNKWETIGEQLVVVFGSSQGVINHPQNSEFDVTPMKFADFVKNK